MGGCGPRPETAAAYLYLKMFDQPGDVEIRELNRLESKKRENVSEKKDTRESRTMAFYIEKFTSSSLIGEKESCCIIPRVLYSGGLSPRRRRPERVLADTRSVSFLGMEIQSASHPD